MAFDYAVISQRIIADLLERSRDLNESKLIFKPLDLMACYGMSYHYFYGIFLPRFRFENYEWVAHSHGRLELDFSKRPESVGESVNVRNN